MTDLEYRGSLVDDIKLIRKSSDKREKMLFKFDLFYLAVLIVYLIYFLARVANGFSYLPALNLFANTLIIIRNTLYIKHNRIKNKAYDARYRIKSLANKLFEKKSEDNNNICGHLYINNFEDSVVIEEKERVKKYDENNDVYSYIDTVINYIYLLDDEEALNVLKEVKSTIKEDGEKRIESTIALLNDDELPEELPVKQVLKLRKDN